MKPVIIQAGLSLLGGSRIEYIKIMRDLREDADKTQQEIADLLGTSQTMYARYERGANELPLHHLITLCGYYHVSADYFLGLTKLDKPGARTGDK